MSLGDSNITVESGGGQQTVSAAQLARAIVQVGVSPVGTPYQLLQLSDSSSVIKQLYRGPLAEAVALRVRSGQTAYAMPIDWTSDGALGAVVQAGTGTGAITVVSAPHELVEIKIKTAGALGTMAFAWRVGGIGAFSAPVTSSASAPYVFKVPGTFCKVNFAAGTYVLNSSYAIGVDGILTTAGSAISAVTFTASPLDSYEVVVSVVTPGLPGAAVVSISLDKGQTTLPNYLIPSAGVISLPDTGLALTFANTFVSGESYSFLTSPPSHSTSDLNAAMTALQLVQNVQFENIHVVTMPSTLAGAYSQAATLQTALDVAQNQQQLDWQGMCEMPVIGDIVVSGGAAIYDTADTDAAIIAGRGSDTDRASVFSGTYPVTSPITSCKLRRPLGWVAAARFVDTDPKDDLAAPALGALAVYIAPGSLSGTGGRDEYATPGLDSVQINTARSYRGRRGAFLSVTAGGTGWKNMTLDASFQDAGAVRALNVALAGLRVTQATLIAQRPPVNPDGTITETQARAWDTLLDNSIKRGCGLKVGGAFTVAQASSATATVSRSSQLGASPKQLDTSYTFQPLGEVSSVNGTVLFSGTISSQG